MKEIGLSPEDKVICFGQLLGMCDYITFPLGNYFITSSVLRERQCTFICRISGYIWSYYRLLSIVLGALPRIELGEIALFPSPGPIILLILIVHNVVSSCLGILQGTVWLC